MTQILMVAARFLLRFTPYVKCSDCEKSGVAKREVSILNLALYAIIGAIVYFVLNAFNFGAFAIIIAVFTFVALAYANVYYAKPKCQFCSSLNVLIIPFPRKADNKEESNETETLKEPVEDSKELDQPSDM